MVGRSLGLRWRMMLIIVVLPLLVLIPIFFFMRGQYRTSYREARLSKGEMITRQIDQAVSSVEPYVSSIYDIPGLELYLRESIEGQTEVAFVALVLDNGFIVYHSLPELSETFSEDLTHLPEGEETLRRTIQPYGDVYLILRSFPQPGQADRLMYAVVGEYANMVEPSWAGWLPVVSGVAFVLFLIVAMQFFAQRLILAPLKQLSEGAALIGAGDFTHRIESKATDEMGALAHLFNEMGERLQTMVSTLEGQVAERTAALERRTAQLKAVAVVSREAVSTTNVPTLLSTAVQAIAKQFGYYHVGMFLIDDLRDWAVLRAASSEGGAQMMARRHRLRVGQQGIVGSVAALGKPRIALDVGEDAVWFDNPELPKTRSEMALPLIDVDEKVVGVLDVQSAEPAAFSSEDVETLQLLSDQLSVVLRNAKLMEETQGALAELETLQREYSREGWARVSTSMRPTAYEYDRVNVQAVLPIPVPPELLDGTVSHKVVMDGGEPIMLEPMRYRDQVVGVVALSD
ncbi:MAG: GAF domain-containing protein, partial [Anaerolineae bacterium]|nr:GAF domain-containing protein [Anaerolineae bacterium]